jgi:hypothetical protein
VGLATELIETVPVSVLMTTVSAAIELRPAQQVATATATERISLETRRDVRRMAYLLR